MNTNSDAMDIVSEDETNFGPIAKGQEDVLISCYKEMLLEKTLLMLLPARIRLTMWK
jgi:hypothetical protein